jgi:S1-C subfamily serine protease
MRLQCPFCKAKFRLAFAPQVQSRVRCPYCQTAFIIPALRTEAITQAPAYREEPEPHEESAPVHHEEPELHEEPIRYEEPKRRAAPVRRRVRRPHKVNRFPLFLGAVGASVVCLALVPVLIWALSGTTEPTLSATGQVVANRINQNLSQQPEPNQLPARQQPQPAAEVAEVFDEPPERPAQQVVVPVLNRTQQVGFDFPKLSARRGGRSSTKPVPRPEDGKMSLDEIKKAVAYIKVEAGENSATGSGFLLRVEGNSGLVATNCHVVAEALVARGAGVGGAPMVKVVFDSGLPSEQEKAGEVVAVDEKVDLALIRVNGLARMPRPIDPQYSPTPTETLSVLICGFPFGPGLATGSRSPAVSIGKGAVSSLRRNDAGDLALVQIDGAINPGNSGGPVVDTEGRLVGVAVSRIRDSGIGFAIPADELLGLLEGRVHAPLFLPVGVEGGSAVFLTMVPVSDPLKKIRSVSLYVKPNAGAVDNLPHGPDDLWKPWPARRG